MLRRDDDDEVVYERYSTVDPGTPSFTTTELKNQTGKLLQIAMREPIELTSHGRARVFMVPARLYRKFLMLEDAEDVRRVEASTEETRLGPEETAAFLAKWLDEKPRTRKASEPRRARRPAATTKKAAAPAARALRRPKAT